MPVSLNEVISKLPKKRQDGIRRKAKELGDEYKSLQEFRKSIGMTQKDLASEMGVNQVNISQLESRGDMHLSTLRKYVEALGGELEINIRIPGVHQNTIECILRV